MDPFKIIHAILILFREGERKSSRGYEPLIKTVTLFKFVGLIAVGVVGYLTFKDSSREAILGAYIGLSLLITVPSILKYVYQGYEKSSQLSKVEKSEYLKSLGKKNN